MSTPQRRNPQGLEETDFNPHSMDAVLARIFERLDGIKDTQDATLEQVKKTNGRVTVLETAYAVIKGKVAVVSAVVSGAVGLIWWLWSTFVGGN